MPTQNLLRLLLLLILMMRIVLATVCCRFGSWRLVLKLHFCSDFKPKGWSKFWSRSSGKTLKLEFVQHFVLFCRVYEEESWSRFWLQVTLARWTQPSGPLCLWQCFYAPFPNGALIFPGRAFNHLLWLYQEYFMDLYLLAELKTVALKITTVDMLKPPPDFRWKRIFFAWHPLIATLQV